MLLGPRRHAGSPTDAKVSVGGLFAVETRLTATHIFGRRLLAPVVAWGQYMQVGGSASHIVSRDVAGVVGSVGARSRGSLRSGAFAIAATALLLVVPGCASNSAVDTAALAQTPIPAGKARVAITRTSDVLYAAAPATITLNGQNVASISTGGTAVVDVPPGNAILAASAWSYPGEYKVTLNAVAGQHYAVVVSPRSASFGPSLLGPIGGMVDSSANGNAGAFEMRVAEKSTAAN